MAFLVGEVTNQAFVARAAAVTIGEQYYISYIYWDVDQPLLGSCPALAYHEMYGQKVGRQQNKAKAASQHNLCSLPTKWEILPVDEGA